MIREDWKRIAGFHVVDDGTMAAVWIAHDRLSDCIHLYDACIFNKELPAVIAEGLNARGRWIPVGWERQAKAMADAFSERGCNMTPEPYEESNSMAEVISRDIEERMRTGRFKVEARLANWLEQARQFRTNDGHIPREGFPLMSATRIAMGMYDEWARAESTARGVKRNHPDVAVV